MKTAVLRTFILLLAVSMLAACKPAEIPTEPVLENAWIRPAPPGMKMTAGFGTLRNVTGKTLDIESFSSPSLGEITLHLTEVVDGVSSMKEVDIFSLAPEGTLEMKPGGYHLMIMTPVKTVSQGMRVTLEVHTTDGRTFSYEVPVEKR